MELFSVQEIAKQYKISDQTLYAALHRGDLTAECRVGRQWRFTQQSIIRYLSKSKSRPPKSGRGQGGSGGETVGIVS